MSSPAKELLEAVKKAPWSQLFQKEIQNSSLIFEELWEAPKAFLALLAQEALGKHILVLTAKSGNEAQLLANIASLSQRPLYEFPAWETLPSEEDVLPSADIVGERYRILRALSTAKEPAIIFTSLQSCLQKVISPKTLNDLYLHLQVDNSFPFTQLIDRLSAMGYERVELVADKGQFAVRGGIIDIFPVSAKEPARLDFFGDQLEAIRAFDPLSQKSVQKLTEIAIDPADESAFLKKYPFTSLLSYLQKPLILFDDLESLEDRYARLKSLKPNQQAFFTIEEFLDQIQNLPSLYFSNCPLNQLGHFTPLEAKPQNYYASAPYLIQFEIFQRQLQAKKSHHPFISIPSLIAGESQSALLPTLLNLSEENQVCCISSSLAEEKHLKEELSLLDPTIHQKASFYQGYLSSGFLLKEAKLLLFPYTELSHRYQVRRQKLRHNYSYQESESFELNSGDFVVHLNNGIARYQGVAEKKDPAGHDSEYLILEYAEGSKLFVPLQQTHLLNKYVGTNDTAPKLHVLGSNKWKKTRLATEQAILGYAKDLLQTYARRQISQGFAYPEDSPDMQLFEQEFPYQETEDQLKALAAIKADMLSNEPMDRLILGDVGYGKTEVAMRAAFKAVVDGKKQVAVLVPTTVLAMQHFETFSERMAHFPIKVAQLSRFSTSKQTKETIKAVADGKVDILVGTHRLVSKDISFKNLGLIIIDEEQRFGVKVKEHLKQLKSDVDCLTLSATPIPRTLYMSLIGIRQLSQINTPPQDRLPIKTIIAEPNDELIKTALLRELSRDGQAYFIHNRVESIFARAAHLQKLLPEARIAIAHGQMKAEEIDQVFHAFKKGHANILVATSLVENGIDIANANTIIIDRAHHFGISELYQLRGRVGRWNKRAFAYLLIAKNQHMPEIARKRVEALASASGHGGGVKVAMRDLELRGSGNLLGTEQSGHVSQIGFHLYCRLLKQAILTLQGKETYVFTDTKIDTPFPARIPESYIENVQLRMDFYHRLGLAHEENEVIAIGDELKDRFGPLPLEARWLYQLALLRTFASNLGYSLLKVDRVYLIAERKNKKGLDLKKYLLSKGSTPEAFAKNVRHLLSDKD